MPRLLLGHDRPHLVRTGAWRTDRGFAQPAEWQRAWLTINDFEAQLVERGYYAAKFYAYPAGTTARFSPWSRPAQHKITEEDTATGEKADEGAPSTR